MPELRPFVGLRYDPAAVPDASAVICPPYDVISAAERATLAARHPHNAVHVELPENYERAAELFTEWQRTGVLRRDEQPMIYVYQESAAGQRVRGFFCRLKLEEPRAHAGVRAHELTMAGPREDRFRLLRAVGANLSPVVLLYEAPAGVAVDALLEAMTAGQPDLEATDDDGVEHLLWAVDPRIAPEAGQLLAAVSGVPLTIADGHHRYQTALRYCAEVGGRGADHVLAFLVEASRGGLAVLPTHRLISGVEGDPLAHARELFDVEPVEPAGALSEPLRPGVMGTLTRSGGARLRPRPGLARLLPAEASPALRALDVTILNSAYPALFGASADELTEQRRIAYTKDAREAVAAVDAGNADICFLLAPTPVSAVLEVAAATEVMPPKSTYFYPKPATGLVFNVLDG